MGKRERENMKTISVYKAQDWVADSPNQELRVESLTIRIDTPCPEIESGPGFERRVNQFYQTEAEVLVDALWEVLPGGTLDRVFAEMAKRKASLLVIPLLREGN